MVTTTIAIKCAKAKKVRKNSYLQFVHMDVLLLSKDYERIIYINQLEDKPLNKKMMALLGVLIASMMLFSACAVKQSEETATASASPEASATGQVMVAEVNGEPIYYDQYYSIYASACAQYGISEDDATNGPFLKKMVMDSLVNEIIMKQKLKENGYMNLTDEQVAEAEKNAQDYLDSNIDSYYGEQIKTELGEGYTQEQYDTAKAPYEAQILTGMGYTKEEFIDFYKQSIAEDTARKALVGDKAPTDEEVKAKYDENVASDKTRMEEDPTAYESDVVNGVTVYYTPAGVRQVLQVLVQIDDEWSGAISTLRDAGNDTQADYLLEKALADVKGEAEDVLKKIKSGSLTFADAITTYNDDTGMPEEGYFVVTGGTSFVEPFTTAAMGLKAIGDVTDIVATDFGYHIIQYVADVPTGAIAYDDVKQELKESMTASMQDEAWQTVIEEWTSASTIKKYEENM